MTGQLEPSDEQVRAFVAGRYGADAAASLRPAGAGEWSLAFAFSPRAALRAAGRAPGNTSGPELVIRFGRHRTDFAKDALMGQWVQAHPGADGRPALPVPAVAEIGETPWGYFAVSQRRRGQRLDDIGGDEMRRVLPDLLRTLDSVAVLPPAGPGYGPWDDGGRAPHGSWRSALLAVAQEQPRTAGWRDRLASRVGPAAVFRRGLTAFDRMLAGLERSWPDPAGPRRIVHGDLLSGNVLVQPGVAPAGDPRSVPADPARNADFGTVTAVLDWGNALYGDPLYDLAWLRFWWPWYPAWAAISIGDEIRRHRAQTGRDDATAAGALTAYQLHIGLDSLSYNAFRERWDILDRVADQVDALLHQ